MMGLFLWQASIYPVLGKGGISGDTSKLDALKNTAIRSNKLVIQRGETLWDLALRYHTTVDELAELNQLESPDQIRAGMILALPNTETEGNPENLVTINASTNSHPLQVAAEPKIPTYEIFVNGGPQNSDKAGDELVPGNLEDGRKLVGQESVPALGTGSQIVSRSLGRLVSTEEIDLLTRVIYGEARGENFEGQVAVGAVVLNRMKDPRFPKTIKAIIYQTGAFTAVADRQIHLNPDDLSYKAAEAALAGVDPTNGAIFYYNPRIATDRWIKSRPVVKKIGNHTFSI